MARPARRKRQRNSLVFLFGSSVQIRSLINLGLRLIAGLFCFLSIITFVLGISAAAKVTLGIGALVFVGVSTLAPILIGTVFFFLVQFLDRFPVYRLFAAGLVVAVIAGLIAGMVKKGLVNFIYMWVNIFDSMPGKILDLFS